jgi:hypothetical protein
MATLRQPFERFTVSRFASVVKRWLPKFLEPSLFTAFFNQGDRMSLRKKWPRTQPNPFLAKHYYITFTMEK